MLPENTLQLFLKAKYRNKRDKKWFALRVK